MVSVLLSTYNETLKEVQTAVESMLNQTYEDMEVVVVLDNPENKVVNEWLTEKAAEPDSRVRCVIHEKNEGLVKSLNDAFTASAGDLIARMDADDISMPQRIEKQVAYMQKHPECALLGTKRIDIDEAGRPLPTDYKIVTTDKAIKRMLRYGSAFTHPTIMLKRSVLEELGGYREVPSAEDFDLFLRCAAKDYGMANLNEPLLYYRIRTSGISRANPYKAMCGSHYALRCARKGMQPFDYPCEEEKFVANYRNFSEALSGRKLGKLLGCIAKDGRLLYELYRTVRFKLIMSRDGE